MARRRRRLPPRNRKGRFTRRRRSGARRRRSSRKARSRAGFGFLSGSGKKIFGARPIFWVALLGLGLWAWNRKQQGLPMLPGGTVA